MSNEPQTVQPSENKPITPDIHFQLTPWESLILNMQMPCGFKLEVEEKVIKSIEQARLQEERLEQQRIAKKKLLEINNKKQSTVNSRDHSETFNSNKVSKISAIKLEVNRKCEKSFWSIRNHEKAEYFYINKYPDSPSLSLIERNIKNYKYNQIHEFIGDLRKLWGYFFKNYNEDPNLYESTLQISDYTEGVIKELEAPAEEKPQDIMELNKKLYSLQKEFKDFSKGTAAGQNMYQNKKNDRFNNNNNLFDKPMSMQEKADLGREIRRLNKEQLKGIIKWLTDQKNIESKQKFFEFDIDTLSTRKLRELENYVRNCLKNGNGDIGGAGHSNNSTIKNGQRLETNLENKNKWDSSNGKVMGNNNNILMHHGGNIGQQSQVQKRDLESWSSSSDSDSLSSLDMKK